MDKEKFNSLLDRFKKVESYIDENEDYNPENKKATVGSGMKSIVGIIGQIRDKFTVIGDSKEGKAEHEKIEDSLEKLMEYTPKIYAAYQEDSDAKLEDILSEEELEDYQKLVKKWRHAIIREEALPDVERALRIQGIPYVKVAVEHDKTQILFDEKYNQQVKTMGRRLGAGQKMGLFPLEEFDHKYANLPKLQITHIPDWKAEMINDLMKEMRLEGGMIEATSDRDKLEFNLIFKKENEALVNKLLLEVEFQVAALQDAGTDLITINKYKGAVKDRRLLENVVENSLYTDFYLCSESIDKYMKADREGFVLYANGKPVYKLNRSEVSEEEFIKKFYEYSKQISNNNMVILPETDFKNNRVECLKKMKTQEGRLELMANKHANSIDYATYDAEFMESLKRDSKRTRKELLEIAQSDKSRAHTSTFILDAMNAHIENDNRPLQYSSFDLLDNDKGVPSIATLIQRYVDYADAYAKNSELNNWYKASSEVKEQINYTEEQITEIKSNIEKANIALKDTISSLKTTFDLSDDVINNLSQGIAIGCGATVNIDTGQVTFADSSAEIQKQIAQMQQLKTKTMTVKENIEKNSPIERKGTLQDLIDKGSTNREILEKADIDEFEK